jgi:lipoate-protein ligase B
VNTLQDKTLITKDILPLEIRDCGLERYNPVLQIQQQLVEQRKRNEIPDTILILEHLPVITLGARQPFNKLLVKKEFLLQKDIDVEQTRRGGGTTAHNPGQLVFYPILDLHRLGIGINDYIRKLESIGAELLVQLGVETLVRKGLPGLWVGEKKIASIGVRVSRFITSHGMAINIQNDLAIFDFIKPCGLDDVEMTSVLKETHRQNSMSQVKESLSQLLQRHFK